MLSLELDSVDVEQGFPYDLCNTSHEIIFPCNHRIYHTQFLLFVCGNNNVLCDSRQKNCCCVKESCGIVIALGTFFPLLNDVLYTLVNQYILECTYLYNLWAFIVVHILLYFYDCIVLISVMCPPCWDTVTLSVRTKTFAHFWTSLMGACSVGFVNCVGLQLPSTGNLLQPHCVCMKVVWNGILLHTDWTVLIFDDYFVCACSSVHYITKTACIHYS